MTTEYTEKNEKWKYSAIALPPAVCSLRPAALMDHEEHEERLVNSEQSTVNGSCATRDVDYPGTACPLTVAR